MAKGVKIFVSYSHQDGELLTELLGFLKGLEDEGVELWTDRKIAPGELWDDTIKARIADCDVALVLVSQAFLDSPYCKDVEIRGFLERKVHIVPIVLSACEWRRHEWLSSRQFLPGGDKTVEEDYPEPGPRRRLFLDVRTRLRELIEQLPAAAAEPNGPSQREVPPNPFTQTLAIREPAQFVGREAELRRLQAMLAGGSVALLGEAKIGKSSLLWQLARSWEGEVLGPIDLQGIADADDLHGTLADLLGLPDGNWQNLRSAFRERPALLLLDELDAGSDRCLDYETLGRLRAVCGANTACKVVVVSRRPLREVFPDTGRGSPAYNFLVPLSVGPMKPAEVRRLLAHPWAPLAAPFDGATIDHLLAIAGGHPFKVQRAAFHRYDALVDPDYDWQAAWRQDLEHLL